MKPIHALLIPLALVLALFPACRRNDADLRTSASERPTDSATLTTPAEGTASVVLAGGCFWCTEAVFEGLAGVDTVVSGYAGGRAETADYQLVSAGRTKHAEAILVTYEPERIGLEELLDVFFRVAHDPTQLNYQGPDHGTQYRSAVFFANEAERDAAQAAIDALEAEEVFDDPIVTTLEPLERFHPAEEYHQDFVRRNPEQPYVVRYALPKVKKLAERFPELLETAE